MDPYMVGSGHGSFSICIRVWIHVAGSGSLSYMRQGSGSGWRWVCSDSNLSEKKQNPDPILEKQSGSDLKKLYPYFFRFRYEGQYNWYIPYGSNKGGWRSRNPDPDPTLEKKTGSGSTGRTLNRNKDKSRIRTTIKIVGILNTKR